MEETPASRRAVIGGIAGGLVAGAAVDRLLPSAHGPPDAVTASEPTAGSDGDPISEGETPYAVYQHVPWHGGYRPTLPINLVCPLERAEFADVIDVLEGTEWYSRPAENARYAYDRERDTWRRSDWSAADTVFGVGGRLHVRCWHLDGTASIQAHTDTAPSPHHRIRSFEEAARLVAGAFAEAGWRIGTGEADRVALGNATAPDHSGWAWEVRR